MRRFLVAGCALMLLSSRQAHAQGIPVIDPASIFEQVQQLAQEAKTYLVQAQSYGVQIQQYASLVQEVNGFIHDPNLATAMALVNKAGLSNDLPISPFAVQTLLNGNANVSSLGSVLGQLSNLSGLIGTNYAANHVYTPTDGSWASQQLIANGNSIAAVQGQQQAVYQNLRDHLPILQALVTRLQTASNPKDVADAQAQIAAQVAWTNNLQAEISSINANYQAAKDSRQQQIDEATEQSFDTFIASANALPNP